MKRVWFVVTLALVFWVARSSAYSTYSQNKDATNCRACHGDFQASNYVSFHDGTPWNTSLMSGHSSMVGFTACSTCHQSATTFFPVLTDESAGSGGLSPTSCVGCHGREEDAGHDEESAGLGAGLRQHHFRAGVTVCAQCHSDADPASYVPVVESVPPSNYFTPDSAHPNKPTDPCNANGSESEFGPVGLDNDGNGLYDLADPACQPPAACVGDCGETTQVTVDDILTMVNIALGNANVTSCSAGDANSDDQITVDEILAAVSNALNGCSG
jgi:mono/diheme cytochrome c family protein